MLELMAVPNGDWDPALATLLSSLEESKSALSTSDEEFGFLSTLLQSKELHALVKVCHRRILYWILAGLNSCTWPNRPVFFN